MVSVNGDCQRPTPQQCGSKRAHKGVARGAVKQAYLKEGLLVAQVLPSGGNAVCAPRAVRTLCVARAGLAALLLLCVRRQGATSSAPLTSK